VIKVCRDAKKSGIKHFLELSRRPPAAGLAKWKYAFVQTASVARGDVAG
jgi:hypothetical protein